MNTTLHPRHAPQIAGYGGWLIDVDEYGRWCVLFNRDTTRCKRPIYGEDDRVVRWPGRKPIGADLGMVASRQACRHIRGTQQAAGIACDHQRQVVQCLTQCRCIT